MIVLKGKNIVDGKKMQFFCLILLTGQYGRTSDKNISTFQIVSFAVKTHLEEMSFFMHVLNL